MKYCIKYNINYKEDELKPFDEIIINYNQKHDLMIQYIKDHPTHRIIIYCNELRYILKLLKIHQQEPNLTFTIAMPYRDWHTVAAQEATKEKIPFFFDLFAYSFDILQGLVALDVSDIYIGADLGFELDKVKAIAKNIQLRCYPDLGQSTFDDIPNLKKFFIRPEDVLYYEPYIDTFEMIANPIAKRKIYAINKKWYGKLNEIIESFDEKEEMDSRYIISSFGENRTTCGKRCMKNGKCHICESVMILADTLDKNNLIITKNDI